jgi:hypothetical protein
MDMSTVDEAANEDMCEEALLLSVHFGAGILQNATSAASAMAWMAYQLPNKPMSA